MRSEDPVHWCEAIQAWVLTRYDDVIAAFRDPRLSNQRMDLLIRYQLQNTDITLAKDFAVSILCRYAGKRSGAQIIHLPRITISILSEELS
jgi:hypothetical protein